jgi:hypothetical protein
MSPFVILGFDAVEVGVTGTRRRDVLAASKPASDGVTSYVFNSRFDPAAGSGIEGFAPERSLSVGFVSTFS